MVPSAPKQLVAGRDPHCDRSLEVKVGLKHDGPHCVSAAERAAPDAERLTELRVGPGAYGNSVRDLVE